MRIFIWGTGKIAGYLYEMFDIERSYKILGFIDNNSEKQGGFFKNYSVFSPAVLESEKYDRVLILCVAEDAVISQMKSMGIGSDRIIRYSQMEIAELALRPVKVSYLAGEYYERADEQNIPETITVLECNEKECDKFIINDYRESKEYYSEKYNLPVEKIDDIGLILKHQYFQLYCQNDSNLEKEEKECIRKIILSMNNKIFFFENMEKYEAMEVYHDEVKGLRYVDFYGKKLYISRKMKTYFDNKGVEKVSNLWFEQDKSSPHRYFRDHEVSGVVVDCGACEGNFSLYNIEKIEKLFLVECDADWAEALKATFEPYQEKVEICNKFLGEGDGKDRITLDELLQGIKPDYIKIDVEGGEIEVLHGAEGLLKHNENCKWNVCVYHKKSHAEDIQKIFGQYNIEVGFSAGFMNYIYDKDILNNIGLRKCLLYTK